MAHTVRLISSRSCSRDLTTTTAGVAPVLTRFASRETISSGCVCYVAVVSLPATLLTRNTAADTLYSVVTAVFVLAAMEVAAVVVVVKVVESSSVKSTFSTPSLAWSAATTSGTDGITTVDDSDMGAEAGVEHFLLDFFQISYALSQCRTCSRNDAVFVRICLRMYRLVGKK